MLMDIQVKMIKELPDGSAICTLDMDDEAKEFLIGEGFLTILKRSLETSVSAIKPSMLEEVDKHVEL
jgi:hypothetical protein